MINYEELSPDQLKALCETLRQSLDLAVAAGDDLVDRMRASKTLAEADRKVLATWWEAMVELHESSKEATKDICGKPKPGAKLN